MAGLYVHIPFCRKACNYCDFHFTTNLKNKRALIEAIALECAYWREDWENEIIETLYFGGGTPSLLSAEELEILFSALRANFTFSDAIECTFEVNPEDVTQNQVLLWKQFGINRLSIGIQAFQEEILSWMNRAHNAAQAENAVLLASESGITNLSIDLIYGIPGLSEAEWNYNLEKASRLPIQHISCYALTVEERTKLHLQIQKEGICMPPDDVVNLQFDQLSSYFQSQGFLHYEISNLGKPNFVAKHNSNYWSRKAYLGLGPSAHSYRENKRWYNIKSNTAYQNCISSSKKHYEIEILSETDVFNEIVMTSLRTSKGLNASHFGIGELNPKNISQNKDLDKLYSDDLIYLDDSFIKLTQKGRHFADGIAAQLFK